MDEPVDNYVTVDLMREYAKRFGSRLNHGIKYIQATAAADELPLQVYFSFQDGAVANREGYQKRLASQGWINEGRCFTDKELQISIYPVKNFTIFNSRSNIYFTSFQNHMPIKPA